MIIMASLVIPRLLCWLGWPPRLLSPDLLLISLINLRDGGSWLLLNSSTITHRHLTRLQTGTEVWW